MYDLNTIIAMNAPGSTHPVATEAHVIVDRPAPRPKSRAIDLRTGYEASDATEEAVAHSIDVSMTFARSRAAFWRALKREHPFTLPYNEFWGFVR